MRVGWRFLCALALVSVLGCGGASGVAETGGADSGEGGDAVSDVVEDAGEDVVEDVGEDISEDVGDAPNDAIDDIEADPDGSPECAADDDCDAPFSCVEGACACPGGASVCGAYCVDWLSDPQHCGECDNLCPAGSKCKDGECACVGMMTPAFCGNQCADLDSDPANCGECGEACEVGSDCESGACTCDEGLTLCAGSCADTSTSLPHCGGCEQPCGTLETCHEGVCLLPAGPRPVSPLSTSRSTGALVTLRWEPGILGETRVEICANHACDPVVQEWTLGQGVGELVAEMNSGVHFWRVRSVVDGEVVNSSEGNPVWQFHVAHASAGAPTTLWGAVPDFDMDGYADVIVGACGLGGTGCGSAVFVFPGLPGGVDTVAATIISGPPSGTFGQSTSSAGDVNGDGYPDLVVGSWVSSSAYVYLSGPEGIEPEPLVEIQEFAGLFPIFGVSVSSAGDVNGDGYADVVGGNPIESSIYVYFGSASGPSNADSVTLYSPSEGAGMGISADGTCDVNGDGFADVIAGNGTSQAVVFHGGPEGPSPDDATVLDGETLCPDGTCNFGISVACAGDVNGDGFGDVVVGSHAVLGAMVFEGGPFGVTAESPTILEGLGTFGISVAAAGDINGDGFSDVLSAGDGEFFVHFGSAEGVDPIAGIVRTSEVASFGAAVVGGRDVNGDGFMDVIVGAPSAASAYLYLGTEGGLEEDPVLLLGPSNVGFGYVVAGLWPPTRR